MIRADIHTVTLSLGDCKVTYRLHGTELDGVFRWSDQPPPAVHAATAALIAALETAIAQQLQAALAPPAAAPEAP